MHDSFLFRTPALVRVAARGAVALGVLASALTGEWVLASIGACALGAAFAALGGYVHLRNSATRIGWFEFLLGRWLDDNPPAAAVEKATP